MTGSWYIDTVKALDIAMIYGGKQPEKVKRLIRSMFAMDSRLFTVDFVKFIKALHQYV